MTDTIRPATRNRYLIATGTAAYTYLPTDAQLPSVADELARIIALFAGQLGYTHGLPELGFNPTQPLL